MSTDDDDELMRRYARGDMRAFETLYRRHKSALYRYLVRQTRNTETANDLFQDAWSKVIASRDRYEPRAQFRTFLFRIAHNCFIDHCRRAVVRNESGGGADGWESMLPGSEHDQPDARAEQAQLTASYRAALATLPAEQRDAFLLYESGLSLEEVASVSAVGPETAKSRLRYAVTKLRAILAPAATAAPPALASSLGAGASGAGPPVVGSGGVGSASVGSGGVGSGGIGSASVDSTGVGVIQEPGV
jgi:RNA polymerase sigma-70 factor (ECF subfamily)